jgi:hypothetical protein
MWERAPSPAQVDSSDVAPASCRLSRGSLAHAPSPLHLHPAHPSHNRRHRILSRISRHAHQLLLRILCPAESARHRPAPRTEYACHSIAPGKHCAVFSKAPANCSADPRSPRRHALSSATLPLHPMPSRAKPQIGPSADEGCACWAAISAPPGQLLSGFLERQSSAPELQPLPTRQSRESIHIPRSWRSIVFCAISSPRSRSSVR